MATLRSVVTGQRPHARRGRLESALPSHYFPGGCFQPKWARSDCLPLPTMLAQERVREVSPGLEDYPSGAEQEFALPGDLLLHALTAPAPARQNSDSRTPNPVYSCRVGRERHEPGPYASCTPRELRDSWWRRADASGLSCCCFDHCSWRGAGRGEKCESKMQVTES